MAEESEKRFHSVMDKLFNTPPKSSSSSSSAQSSRGQKRSASELVELRSSSNVAEDARKSSSDPPLCRPWDRADLMKRLSTFKSMTWFAKPEAMSALNCAKRGWINVDIDTISCEACGSRLLFSTPSAWNRQQVENLAAVFSLKLDNGHKSLCPWIDNVCDDVLSKHPPTPPQVLTEKFKERCVALSQLSALPVISSSAIEYVKSPAFEQIFEQPLVLEYENGSADIQRTECIGEGHDADLVKKYYQAQKLIALCGWDPRSLPYVVGLGCKSSPFLEMENISNSHNIIASQKETSVDVQSAGIDEQTEANGNPNHSNRPQCNPDSVALDCKLCGASVGLWAFVKVPQPMELVRLVGNAEINGKTDHGNNSLSTERRQSLQLTIAGGPPPAKQDFKASISFPVIGRNIRARFCGDSEFGDHRVSDLERAQVDTRCDTPGKENENQTPLTEMDPTKTGTKDGLSIDQTKDLATEIGNCGDNMMIGNEGNGGLENLSAEDKTSKIGENEGAELVPMLSPNGGDLLQISGTNEVLCEEPILAGLDGDIDIDISDLFDQTTSDAILNHQNNEEGNLQVSADYVITAINTESDPKRASLESDKAMDFNPIKQHRHFCPWISSMYNATPGWKQTLSALQREKGFSPVSEKSQSSSIIKVDDPITSVRNLFTSPLKRMKRDLLSDQSTQS